MPVAKLTPSKVYVIVCISSSLGILGIFVDVPDWLMLGSGYLSVFLICLFAVSMTIARKRAGKIFPIPTDNSTDKPRSTRIAGPFGIIAGCMQLMLASSQSPLAHLSPPARYMFGILIISMGILQLLGGNLTPVRGQIGEHGILDQNGKFFAWENIERVVWDRAVGRLTFKLKPPLREKRVVIAYIPSEFRPEIYPYLEQHFYNIQNVSK